MKVRDSMKVLLTLLLLCFPVRLEAQIAVVQSVGAQSTGAPVSSIQTTDIDTTTGNLIICDTSSYFASGTTFGPSKFIVLADGRKEAIEMAWEHYFTENLLLF